MVESSQKDTHAESRIFYVRTTNLKIKNELSHLYANRILSTRSHTAANNNSGRN